ncbi:YheU family protein [Aliikangiella marina]|uniref:YheU family protein n=2 Tax=Aliikangiella marina TaxID=1712262 RepID=A0A545TIT5_9GAMM|nr:YheU family protein [Aliikangiella marina]
MIGNIKSMLIDYSTISREALEGLAKEYVLSKLSETDSEIDLATWTKQVLSMIKSGELLVEYSEANESVYLKTPEELLESKANDSYNASGHQDFT